MRDALDEAGLVSARRRGDQRAFEALFRRYQPVVGRACRRALVDAGDAEEAVQETFLKAWKAVGSLHSAAPFEPWLRCIARNVCLDHLRAGARRRVTVVGDLPEGRPGAEPTPEEVVAGGDPRLDLVLARLAPAHRAAVEMRFVDGLSHAEMAGALASSPLRVKALVHRARARLSYEWAAFASTA